MSDCRACGEPPSICRCSLADRLESKKGQGCRPAIYRVRSHKEQTLPLDQPEVAEAMTALETEWRVGTRLLANAAQVRRFAVFMECDEP